MATTTYTLIARQTVGSGGASSVTFSSIPQNFTDLKVVISARSTYANQSAALYLRFNNSNTANTYSYRYVRGNGSSANSYGATNSFTEIDTQPISAATTTANTFSNTEFYIPNYAVSGVAKSVSSDNVMEDNAATNVYASLTAGGWTGTGAITEVDLFLSNGSFDQFSTFYLYGISNSSTQIASNIPYALGGDVIVNDGTYWYHAFKYSGTFTPLKGLSADCLVIAGGGAGGSITGNGGGGGGAGGLLTQIGRSLLATSYTVTIGAGGTGVSNDAGGSGVNTVFDTITAIGGGGGGGNTTASVNGGSGGGAAGGAKGSVSGGSATQGNSGGATGYGNAGGSNSSGSASGGGGGAGAVGNNSSGAAGAGGSGAGGTGFTNYTLLDAMGSATGIGQLSSGHYYYAGGGGGGYTTGGAGGLGGGGRGDDYNSNNRVAGTANLGAGGGGQSSAGANAGANGGSGLVIVRYAI